MDDTVAARLTALEAEVAHLRAERRHPQDAPSGGRGISRRHLILGGGLAAAGYAGAPGPAEAQAAISAATVSVTPVGGVSSSNVQNALAEIDREKQPMATLDVRIVGAMGDGQADDTQAIQTALDVVAGFGGGTVSLPAGTFAFSSRIVVPDGVDLYGVGGHQQGGSSTGSTLKATSAAAQVVINGVGGVTGNFGIDGNRVANPDSLGRKGLLYVDAAVVRQFLALRVSRSLTDGVVLRGAQNCTFSQCMFSDCTRHGLVLDSYALGSAFIRCDVSNNGGDNVLIRTSEDDLRVPNYNTFLRCAFERGLWREGGWNGPNNSAVNITSAGDFNCFIHCGFTLPTETSSTSGALVLVSGGRTTFDSCDWVTQRPSTRAVRVTAPGTATFVGRNLMQTPIGIEWNRDGAGNEPSGENVAGLITFGQTTVPWTGTARPHETASFSVGRPHEVVLDPRDYLDPADGQRKGSSYGMRVRRRGESGFRHQVASDGEIQGSDGTTWTPKARWRVDPAGGWSTPDRVQVGAGLHISAGGVSVQEGANPDPSTIPAGTRCVVYVRGDKLVVAFKDGGTVRYKWLPLTGTSVSWVHSTTPP